MELVYPLAMERRWAFPLVLTSILVVFIVFTSINVGVVVPSLHTVFSGLPPPPPAEPAPPLGPPLPRLAYLVSGSKGDLDRLWRTLRAVYHPRNLYVVHLDRESPVEERTELAARVAGDPVFASVGNVRVIEKANMVTYRGSTMVANTLHACAVLLKMSRDWDWFINLSASDYPLVTQDGHISYPSCLDSDLRDQFHSLSHEMPFLCADLLHAFSTLPKNISFVEHTSNLGWKEDQRAKPLIVDPGLHMSKKSDVFWVSPKRALPTAFKLFTGSAWVVLTREFVEYCIWGWDNLPRTLLMYYTNFVSAPEGYFHTVICNAPEFAHTVANHDLHYIAWDNPPKQHPRSLKVADMPRMIGSNVPFARKFNRDDPVLDRIDAELLGRVNGSFVPGGWCAGSPRCSEVGELTELRAGPGALRVSRLMDRIVRSDMFVRNQCR